MDKRRLSVSSVSYELDYTGVHLQWAAHALETAANVKAWDKAQSNMNVASDSMRYVAATTVAPQGCRRATPPLRRGPAARTCGAAQR